MSKIATTRYRCGGDVFVVDGRKSGPIRRGMVLSQRSHPYFHGGVAPGQYTRKLFQIIGGVTTYVILLIQLSAFLTQY
jgi:hypothetical protein